jgi:hypothetical protein
MHAWAGFDDAISVQPLSQCTDTAATHIVMASGIAHSRVPSPNNMHIPPKHSVQLASNQDSSVERILNGNAIISWGNQLSPVTVSNPDPIKTGARMSRKNDGNYPIEMIHPVKYTIVKIAKGAD